MNTKSHTRATIVLAASCMVCALLPATSFASDAKWHFRVAAISMNPDSGSVRVPASDEEYSYDGSSGTGLAIDLEYRASRRLGIDVGVISATPSLAVTVGEQPFTISADAEFRVTPVFAALNIHLTPESRFDLYAGPMVAYVIYDDFDLSAGPGLTEFFDAANDLAWGAVIGADLTLGGGDWSLNAAVRYLATTLEARPADGSVGEAEIDPTIYSIGVGYRF